MILNGLSYSAVSVAQDATLRRSIRKNVNDMKFLEKYWDSSDGARIAEKSVGYNKADIWNHDRGDLSSTNTKWGWGEKVFARGVARGQSKKDNIENR